jgi:copper chaperone
MAQHTTKFTVEGMTCGGCEKSVVNATSAVPGVAQVSADRQQNRVVVTWQNELPKAQERQAIETVCQVIEAAGFDCRPA